MMGKYRGFHKIFYQASRKSKPWAIEVCCNINIDSGSIIDVELSIYHELMAGVVRTYTSDKAFNHLGLCTFALNRLKALSDENPVIHVYQDDCYMFVSDFSQEYDKVMLEGGKQ